MIGFGLDALSVIFELLIYQFFFHHFFGKPAVFQSGDGAGLWGSGCCIPVVVCSGHF